MIRPALALATLAVAPLLFASCAPAEPRLRPPTTLHDDCPEKAKVLTSSILSVLSSVGSDIGVAPAEERIPAIVAAQHGIIAGWDAPQPLIAPELARALGVGDRYVDVRRLVIPSGPALGKTRTVYLTVHTGTGDRTIAVTAYDAQDICGTGQRML